MIISFKDAFVKRESARALLAATFRDKLGEFLTQRGFEPCFDFEPTGYAAQILLATAHIVGSAIFSYEVSSAQPKLTVENFVIVAETTCIVAEQLAKLAAIPLSWQVTAEGAISQILEPYLDSSAILRLRNTAILTHRGRSQQLSRKRIEELSQSVLRTIEDESDNALAHTAGLLISSLKAVA
jgi:hypothetical protein